MRPPRRWPVFLRSAAQGSLLGAEFQVNMLTNGAVGVGCIRCHSTTIVPYLEASS